MENKTNRIYLPLKLQMLMTPELHKLTSVLFAFQKEGIVTYSHKNAEFCKMDASLCDQLIQTLVDRKIITPVPKDDNYWKFRINTDTLQRFNEATWDDINGASLIKLSEEIKFNKTEAVPSESDEFEKMSKSQLERLMKRIQQEIRTMEDAEKSDDGLPW